MIKSCKLKVILKEEFLKILKKFFQNNYGLFQVSCLSMEYPKSHS